MCIYIHTYTHIQREREREREREMVIAALFAITKNWKQSKCSSIGIGFGCNHRHIVSKREKMGGGINWEIGIDIYTPLYIK